MAEIELSVLSRQALAECMDNQDTLIQAIQAWEEARNAAHATVDWQFTTQDARIKLKRPYPSFKD